MPVSKGNRHTDHRVFSVQHEDGELQGNNPNTETLTKLFGPPSKASGERSRLRRDV
jgi:hypothetical protein